MTIEQPADYTRNIMGITRHVISVVFLLLFLSSSLGATKYAGEFFDLRTGPKGMGMGGTGVSLDQDFTFLAWNPSATASISERQISLMHSEMFDGLAQYDYIGVHFPFARQETVSSLAFVLIRLGIDRIPVTEIEDMSLPPQGENVTLKGFEEDSEYLFLMNWAREAWKRCVIGSNIKLLYRNMIGYDCFGFGMDAGTIITPSKRIRVGLNLQDVPLTVLFWNTGTKEYVFPSVKTGASYRLPVRRMNTSLTFAVDLDIRFEGRDLSDQLSLSILSLDSHGGIEALVNERIALRCGLNRGDFTGGVTLHIFDFDIDYAYIGHNELGTTYRISGLYRF
jgi:hypothetical protein